MPYLVTLTPEQRLEKKSLRLGSKKLPLLQNRVATAAANPGLLPSNLNLAKLQEDAKLVTGVAELSANLCKLLDSVNDTLLVIGNPVAVTAAEAMAHIKAASHTAQRLRPTGHRKSRALRAVEEAASAASLDPATSPVTSTAPVAPVAPAVTILTEATPRAA